MKIVGYTAAILTASLISLFPPRAFALEVVPGVVSISLGSEVVTMDPHAASSALTTTMHRYVFDTLTHRPKGVTKAIPWAAKKVVQVNPTTIDFFMREGVKFTNGEDVDAESVKFSLLRPRIPGYKNVQKKRLRSIKRVEVVSKWVARVILKKPDPGMVNRMADWGNLVPPKHYANTKPEDVAIKPIGSGPYIMVRWDKGSQMVFKANPNHWNTKIKAIKNARVVPIKESGTKVAALLKGEVDLINQLPSQHLAKVKKSKKARSKIVQGTRIFHLGFSHAIDSPLQKLSVRRAISHAIDRSVIVKSVVDGHGNVANQALHEWTEGHDPNAKWPYNYDLGKAKKMLAEAGYPNGFEIDFIAPAGRYTKDKEVTQALAGMLNAAGVKVNFKPLAWKRFVQVFRARGKAGAKPFIYYIGYGNGSGDSDGTLGSITSCKGSWSGYCNPKVDEKLQSALTNLDLKARGVAFRDVVKMMTKDVSHVMIWQTEFIYGLGSKVEWDARNDGRIYLWDISRR
jgi:peptide/nickel transport system substrate-binding protein